MLYNMTMKKKIIYFVMSLSLALSASAIPIAVHANSFGSTSQAKDEVKATSTGSTETEHTGTTTTTTAPKTDDSIIAPETTDDSAGRPTRLETYKKELKEVLTAATKIRITERCTAAQGVLKGRVTNNGKSTIARAAAYDSIVSKLQEVVTAASAEGANVTDLQANIAALQAKIVAFKTANATYQQALTDVGALDCKTDPVAFKAALEAARTDQAAVLTSAKDIRSYVNDTVKVTLKTLKTKLNS